MPTALKDLFEFKPGWPATFGGIRALRDSSVPARRTYAEGHRFSALDVLHDQRMRTHVHDRIPLCQVRRPSAVLS